MPSQAQPRRLDQLSFYLRRRPAAAAAAAAHGITVKAGFLSSSFFLCNHLIHAYASESATADARKLFDEIPLLNPDSWSTMISGYAKVGQLKEAVTMLRAMRCTNGGRRDEEDDSFWCRVAHGNVIKGCSRASDLRTGAQLHCSTVKLGFESDSFMAASVIDLYWKCGDLEGSRKVFGLAPHKDAATWTTMISAFASQRQQDKFKEAAFLLFRKMIAIGVWPVAVTFGSLVKIFDDPSKINQAKQVHGCMLKLGVNADDLLGSALVTMYGKCGGVDEVVRLSARVSHKDVVFWTSLLVGFVQNGLYPAAIEVFREMIEEEAMLDGSAIVGVLGAFSAQKQLRFGEEAHGYALRSNLISDSCVVNALINLYGKCGQVRKAEAVFQAMEQKRDDPVCWTTLLTCYGQNGLPEETMFLFRQMMQKGVALHAFSATGALRACSAMAAVTTGEQLHSLITKAGISEALSVRNSLISMYGKCGDSAAALEIFNSMALRDAITWNSIIDCCSHHGFGPEAIILFYQMQREGTRPDDFTFLGVLASCSHAGLVTEGREFFKMMSTVYGLEPKMEHYACMVDLFGRAGRFDEAVEFVNTVPCGSSSLIWESLLGSCSLYREIKLGSMAMEKILQTKPEDPSGYIILSNISASMGEWEIKADALSRMRRRGLQKDPSRSWVEVKGLLHVFSPDDKSHPELHLIYWKLEELKVKMEEGGYVPETHLVLHDTNPQEKDLSLLRHSEKLALAFALIATPSSRPIRIMQNLRCCKDCHTAMKLISRIEGRCIILRDSKRFHIFRDGVCSCSDYW
ncbi:unnamed protein product [Spirodela intermedia]|uniref:DYW domain-containing protein n=2 Tax=Spirodela intermedia TaxID=51605 RepID=A0A7I8K9Y8_SPIIN|nr:unnamed protein product [Spirodela intermedia]CAA6657965.1 unnamed protein product [Spirodela intermedia]CAA7394096.1 unnamed protein product [Spirodela intermedia]